MTYTCPMHPNIKQDQPGMCPECGMTLEPINEPQQEQRKIKQIFDDAEKELKNLIKGNA